MVGLKYVVFNKILLDNLVNKIWNSSTNSYKVFGLDADGEGLLLMLLLLLEPLQFMQTRIFNLAYYQNIFPGINFNHVVSRRLYL